MDWWDGPMEFDRGDFSSKTYINMIVPVFMDGKKLCLQCRIIFLGYETKKIIFYVFLC